MSQDSFHDGDHTSTLLAIENDGKTLINIKASPIFHDLFVSNGTSGSDNGPKVSRHDNSHVAILMATSNDGLNTPIPVYADSGGNLLVKST